MIDLNTLLDPIDPTNRGGVSLLYEGVHQEIMEARREDDASLPRGDWSRPLKVADWQDVTDIGTNTLLKKSKDLRVAVMLTEALIYQKGMAGFNAATSFLIKFVEIFWDDMHPKIEEPADLESRMLILEWFSEKCGFAIKFQNITQHPQITTYLTLHAYTSAFTRMAVFSKGRWFACVPSFQDHALAQDLFGTLPWAMFTCFQILTLDTW